MSEFAHKRPEYKLRPAWSVYNSSIKLLFVVSDPAFERHPHRFLENQLLPNPANRRRILIQIRIDV